MKYFDVSERGDCEDRGRVVHVLFDDFLLRVWVRDILVVEEVVAYFGNSVPWGYCVYCYPILLWVWRII